MKYFAQMIFLSITHNCSIFLTFAEQPQQQKNVPFSNEKKPVRYTNWGLATFHFLYGFGVWVSRLAMSLQQGHFTSDSSESRATPVDKVNITWWNHGYITCICIYNNWCSISSINRIILPSWPWNPPFHAVGVCAMPMLACAVEERYRCLSRAAVFSKS